MKLPQLTFFRKRSYPMVHFALVTGVDGSRSMMDVSKVLCFFNDIKTKYLDKNKNSAWYIMIYQGYKCESTEISLNHDLFNCESPSQSHCELVRSTSTSSAWHCFQGSILKCHGDFFWDFFGQNILGSGRKLKDKKLGVDFLFFGYLISIK